MIEGPGVGGALGDANPNPCPTGAPVNYSGPVNDCIYTDLFAIMGKKSTKGGVDVARATYSRSSATREAAARRHGRVEGRPGHRRP
jgi:hypothetical protein